MTQEATCQALPGVSLRSEIQSIQLSAPSAIGVSTLAASDCYGRTLLAHLRLSPSKQASQAEEDGSVDEGNSVEVMGIEHIAPGDITVEAGWTGAALAPGQPSQSAIARHFPRDVTLFDGPIPVRSLNTLHRPYAVQLLSSTVASSPAGGPVVVVAEGPTVSVWDVRAWGRGARVARLCGNPYAGHYYCLAASENAGQPVLGAAGADRSVSVWDPRKWVTMDRWTNCLKYEATSLHFMAGNPQYCIACGLDYEVVCGRWSGDKRSRLGGGTRTGDLQGVEDTAAPSISYRGDARWMGLARSHDSDVMAGITSSKQLYLAEFECGQGA